MIISTKTNTYKKPNPKILSPLFKQYNIDPQKITIIKNTTNNIKTTNNTNLNITINILTNITTKKKLHKTNIILNNTTNILKTLN